MKMNKIALALTLTATAATAFAAPSPSAYDRIQNGRIDGLLSSAQSAEQDISQLKTDLASTDSKADSALAKSSTALDLASGAKTDAAAALTGLAGKVAQADYDADKAAQGVRDNQQDTLIGTNGQKADAALAGVATNGAAITDLQNKAGSYATKPELDASLAAKVDHADFVANQLRQDKALTDGLATKVNQADFDQSIKDQSDTDRAQDRLTAQLHADVDGKVKTETADRQAADAAHDTALDDHDSRIISNTNALASKVDTSVFAAEQQRRDDAAKVEASKRDGQFVTLSSGVAAAQATGDYAHSRIDAANQNIEANRQALVNTNKRVAQNTADIANHEQRITTLESQTNARFGDLKKQIDNNKKEANAGIAGVAAMASIPQVTDKQDFSIGAGVGNRDGENAMAIGFSGRVTDNVVTKVAVAADTQSGWTFGAGMSYGW